MLSTNAPSPTHIYVNIDFRELYKWFFISVSSIYFDLFAPKTVFERSAVAFGHVFFDALSCLFF